MVLFCVLAVCVCKQIATQAQQLQAHHKVSKPFNRDCTSILVIKFLPYLVGQALVMHASIPNKVNMPGIGHPKKHSYVPKEVLHYLLSTSGV